MDKILEQIGEFATTRTFDDLPPNAVKAAKERLLDTLGCAIGAHDCDPAKIGHQVSGVAIRPEEGGRIVGSTEAVTMDAASFINSCMIRNLDFNDTYPGGHPSDAIGALFAVGPQIGASGKQLITATVIAYEIFIRMQMKGQFRERGWDNGYGIGVGVAAALSNMLGLDRDTACNAIGIAATGNVPMRASRAGQLSMWKGAATAYAVRNSVYAVQLARAGMTGPEAPFTGRHGMYEQITGKIELPSFGGDAESYFIPRAKIKFWPVVYNMQALVWAAIELRKQVDIDELEKIEVHTYWSAWHESGSEPAKWNPQTRETADHSLPYIMAWVLRHGQIDHGAFVPESYLDSSIRPLMNIIQASIDDSIEEDFPHIIRMRVTAKDRLGASYEVNITNPLGHEDNPISVDELGDKFSRLSDPVLGRDRTREVLSHWSSIETVDNLKTSFDLVTIPSRSAEKAASTSNLSVA